MGGEGGREGREAARPLSDERRNQEALRGRPQERRLSARMFFPLSKIVGLIFLPSNFMFLLALAGILLMATRFRRLGLTCVGAAVMLLTVFGIMPAGNWLIWPLETRFPKWDASRGAPHGIVVLGGSIGPENSAARGEPALNESAERVTIVGELSRKFPAARIV